MAFTPPISLSHGGFFVFDMDRMVEFFTSAMGFGISDQAPDESVTFMTADPRDHHQLVIYAGRTKTDDTKHYNHMSFRVPTLGRLREVREKVLAFEGTEHQRTLSHGNTWSFYFYDPEGNRTEVFVDTPWQVHQPFEMEIDLSQSDDEIVRETEVKVMEAPDTQPIDVWRHGVEEKYGID